MEDRRGESPRNSFHDAFREAGPYLTLGLELGLTMIVWSVIGYLLDSWLDTMPWLTMAGVLVGMASLFIQLVRAAKRSHGSERGQGNGSGEQGAGPRDGGGH